MLKVDRRTTTDRTGQALPERGGCPSFQSAVGYPAASWMDIICNRVESRLAIHCQHLIQVPRCPDAPDDEKLWVCPEVYQKTVRGCGDLELGWARHLKRFCEPRRLNTEEVRDMIQEYTGEIITCDCHILEAEECMIVMNGKDDDDNRPCLASAKNVVL